MNAHLLLDSLSPVSGSILTNGVVVAVVILLHIQIATFITGSTTLAAVSEAISMARGDDRHERLGHMLLKSWVYLFGFGSATAIFFVVFVVFVVGWAAGGQQRRLVWDLLAGAFDHVIVGDAQQVLVAVADGERVEQ